MPDEESVTKNSNNTAAKAAIRADEQRMLLEKAKSDFESSLAESKTLQKAIDKCKSAALVLDQSLKKAAAEEPVALERFFADLKLARNPNGEVTKTTDGQVYGYLVSDTAIIWPFSTNIVSVRKDPALANTIDQYTNRSILNCERRR